MLRDYNQPPSPPQLLFIHLHVKVKALRSQRTNRTHKDQSASVVAKSEIMLRARTGKSIPAHWALDEHGQPTTDPNLALKGSMAPSGGYKGFGIGLLVEILASCLSGAVLSKDASPFSGTKGGPPSTGQCFIALDPGAYSGDTFIERINTLATAISVQEGAHLPGSKGQVNRERIANEGVMVNQELLDKINSYKKCKSSQGRSFTYLQYR